MSERHTGQWHPSHDEVDRILDELRPLISEIARRDEVKLAEERWRRGHAIV